MKRKLDDKIEKDLRETIHSVELACGKMSEEEIELARKYSYGEISEKEFFEMALKIAKIN